MQRARPRQRGGQNGDTPNPVSDTVRLAGSRTDTGPVAAYRASNGVTKRIYPSSCAGTLRRADVEIRAPESCEMRRQISVISVRGSAKSKQTNPRRHRAWPQSGRARGGDRSKAWQLQRIHAKELDQEREAEGQRIAYDPADERRRKKHVLNVDEMTSLWSKCAKSGMSRDPGSASS